MIEERVETKFYRQDYPDYDSFKKDLQVRRTRGDSLSGAARVIFEGSFRLGGKGPELYPNEREVTIMEISVFPSGGIHNRIAVVPRETE